MTKLAAVPTLDQVAADPSVVRGLPHQALVDLALKAQGIVTVCQTALLAARPTRGPVKEESSDRLLTARQVAERLGYHVNYVYAHMREWPFTLQRPGQRPRFSEVGLKAWITRQQQGA
jgi:hypothetical protein